jgi:hypothetical protein
MWPARAPFRRAAKWDGVFPIKADLAALSIDEVHAISSYVASHRTSVGAYEFVIGSDLPNEPRAARDRARAASRERIRAYAAAGVTWWIEGAYDRDELRTVARDGPTLDAG